MRVQLKYITFVLALITFPVFAQQGFIEGVISDQVTDELMPGARVTVKNHKVGAYSDFDGQFKISINEGKYVLQVTYMGYDTLIVKEVNVMTNEISVLAPLLIVAQVSDIVDIVIDAIRSINTENAIISLKQLSEDTME